MLQEKTEFTTRQNKRLKLQELKQQPEDVAAIQNIIKTEGLKGMPSKPGLYANIHAKQERIKAGSGEKMRKPGTKGAPTAKSFKQSAKTAKK